MVNEATSPRVHGRPVFSGGQSPNGSVNMTRLYADTPLCNDAESHASGPRPAIGPHAPDGTPCPDRDTAAASPGTGPLWPVRGPSGRPGHPDPRRLGRGPDIRGIRP
jgi:hypothetical protein